MHCFINIRKGRCGHESLAIYTFFIHCICILIFSGSLVSCFEGELEVQSPLLDVGGDDEDGDNGDGDEGDGLPI